MVLCVGRRTRFQGGSHVVRFVNPERVLGLGQAVTTRLKLRSPSVTTTKDGSKEAGKEALRQPIRIGVSETWDQKRMGGAGGGCRAARGEVRRRQIPLFSTYPDVPPHPYLFLPESGNRVSWTSVKSQLKNEG